MRLAETTAATLRYGAHDVLIHTTGNGDKIDLTGELRHPEDFHTKPQVDEVVRFGPAFQSLIGKHEYKGEWTQDALPSLGIYVFEDHLDEAKILSDKITTLASRFVADATLYDDREACGDYFALAKAGYDLMRRERARAFSLQGEPKGIAVSLERGGLVSTRLGLGMPTDAKIPGEFRVVTKRTHLKREPEDSLTVTITKREDPWGNLDAATLQIHDFVNPASGASSAGLILSAEARGIVPARVEHRAIAATKSGVLYNRAALAQKAIETTFEMLFASEEMNGQYYLIDRPVGDAGHILRHNLPSWYTNI